MLSFALVTGASKGLGKYIAYQLASRKIPVLLVARSESELQSLSREIVEKYQVQSDYLAIDLAKRDAALRVYDWCKAREYHVHVLVNNAGYGLWGNFEQCPLENQMDMLELNVMNLVQLSYLFLSELKRQPHSYILNVASTAAYQAVPTLTLYAASKALVLSFSRGLAFELRGSSVSVTCLCPGPTNTHFTERAGMTDAIKKTADKFGMKPEVVARIGVDAMFKRKKEIVPGWTNRIGTVAASILPKSLLERIASSIYA